MSQEQPVNYEAVLSDLERQKAAVENAIAALRQAMTVRTQVGSAAVTDRYGNRRPKDLPAAKPKRRLGNKRHAAATARRPKQQEASKLSVPPTAKQSMTVVQQAEQVLLEAGSPLAVDALIDQIERRFGRKIGKQTLVGILSKRVRKQQTFTRPAPNTYDLAASILH